MLTVALNTPLLAPAGRAPDWVQLLPEGPDIVGMDGRRWRNDQPRQVAMDCRMPMVLDYEHASELRARHGLDAPAAGWIDRLEIRGISELWGHVDWTPKAAQQIQNREYRYLSPVFMHEKNTGKIVRLTSVGLTNQPNLTMTALNHRGTPMNPVSLNRFSPEHQAAIQRFHKETDISEAEAIERFLMEQKCLNALAIQRESPHIGFHAALQKAANIRFYGSEFPR